MVLVYLRILLLTDRPRDLYFPKFPRGGEYGKNGHGGKMKKKKKKEKKKRKRRERGREKVEKRRFSYFFPIHLQISIFLP